MYIYMYIHMYIHIYITGRYASPAAPTLEPCWHGNRRSRRRHSPIRGSWPSASGWQRRLSAGAQLGREGRQRWARRAAPPCRRSPPCGSLSAGQLPRAAERRGARRCAQDPRAVAYAEAGCDAMYRPHDHSGRGEADLRHLDGHLAMLRVRDGATCRTN